MTFGNNFWQQNDKTDTEGSCLGRVLLDGCYGCH